jgi:hypothetical protein
MSMTRQSGILLVDRIEPLIQTIRGQHVLLDRDLAELYATTTKALNQAVKRNLDRFPGDFMFQLTSDEYDSLRSQTVTSKGRGGRRYLPYAFTEHGTIMAASVLNTARAVEVSVFVVRAFVKLREFALQHRVLIFGDFTLSSGRQTL